MNALTMNPRPGAPARRGVLAWLPWVLAAAFASHLVMERALNLYKAGPLLSYALDACLALAVLIWVWCGLRRIEDQPAGYVAASARNDGVWDRGFWGNKQSPWDDDLPPGYPVVLDRTGMTIEDDRSAIL